MRTAPLVATVLTALLVAGCASAEDVATSTPKKVGPPADEPKQTPPTTDATTSSPETPTTPITSTTPSGSSPSSQSPSTSPQTGESRRRLPNVVGALPRFLTPSQNIGCAIGDDQVRCDIVEHVYRAPRKPSDCHGDYGQSIAVTTTGIAAFVCVTDTVIDRRSPVLAYGSSTAVGDFGCTSRQSGIRCYYLRSKHGFWLSQEQPVLF